jgi:hypothetical protein
MPWQELPCMVPAERRGWYRLPEGLNLLPLTFSLKAALPKP